MPSFQRTIFDLRPNTSAPNNTNSRSTWFSYVRTAYSRRYGGTVIPPTMTQFMYELNNLQQTFSFRTEGGPDEACNTLRRNIFPSLPFRRQRSRTAWQEKLKIITWVRMVLAFNYYAKLRASYHLSPSHNVDFIGSASDTNIHRNCWEPRFHGRCVLYIADSKLTHMIELVSSERTEDFWQCIINLYDEQVFVHRLQHPRYDYNVVTRDSQNRTTPESSPAPATRMPPSRTGTVDNPGTPAAQEYLSREEDAVDDMIPDNQQIAAMLARTENLLSRDFRKTLYDMCIAAQMSYPITTQEEPSPQETEEPSLRETSHEIIRITQELGNYMEIDSANFGILQEQLTAAIARTQERMIREHVS